MYESNEYGELVLQVNGVAYGTDTNTSLVHHAGDGNGGPVYDSGWQTYQTTLTLGAGTHTLSLIAVNSESTAADEYVTGYFDNVSVTSGRDAIMTIDASAVNDAPTIATNTGMTVSEGATANVISAGMLNEGDVDDSGTGLTYTYTNVTTNGTLRRNGTALVLNDTFTQADIDGGLLTYDHDGSNTTSDSFQFSLADGGEDGSTPATGTFNITVTSVNSSPTVATNTGSTVDEGSSGNVLTTAMLNEGDPDDSGSGLTYTVTSVTANGVLRNNGTALGLNDTFTQADIDGGLITYDHNGSETTSDSFDFSLADGGENGSTPATGTFNFTINAINDDPVNAGSLPSDITAVEDTSSNVDLSAINLSDADHGGGNLTVTIMTATGGNLTASSGGGVTVGGSGSDTLTLTGSLSNLNAYLDTASNITFLQGTPNNFGNDSDNLTVTVNDLGNTGSGGGGDVSLGVVNVDITAVNDAPFVAVNTGTTVDEGSTSNVITTAMLNEGDVDDVDAGLTYTVTSVTTNGTLRNNGTALGLNDTFTQADIDGGLITYDHNGSETSSDSFNFSLADGGEDGATPATGTFNFTINAINDDPTNSGSLPSDISVTEDVSSDVNLSAINLSDADHGGGNLTLTLTTSTGGDLSASSGGGVTVGGSGTDTLTLTGTLASLNTYLDTASNVQYLHSTAHLNGNDADTISVTVNDNGNTGSGGGGNIALGSVNVDISAVNDVPINTVPGTQTVAEETATSISGISIADLDAASGNLTTRLQVNNGVLNVTLSGSASISAGSNGSGDLTIQGTITDVNSTLASLTYTGNTDVVGTAADTLTVTTNDLGNTGSGGALQDVDNIQIDITAVNDTPVVNGPGSAYSATEQINLTIEGTGFTVSDVDAASGSMTATIAVGEGAITVVVGDSGVSISGGNGTGTVTLTGTLSQLDNLLTGAGTGTITYLNSSDTPSASTTITVTVNDGGNTGADPGLTGDGSSEQDFASQTINITATNDDPTNAGSLPPDISVIEDVSNDVDLSAINLSDVDHGGGNLTVTLSTSTGGNLSASSGGGVTVGGSGSSTLTLTGTLASLNTFLDTASNVQYMHSTAHLNGDNADTINVVVNDLGNTGTGGGTNQNLGTVNVDIGAVNDAPANTVPGTQTVAEETVTAISGISITDVDAASGNLTTRLQVTNGVLNVTLSGSASISAGSNASSDLTIQGSVTDINATLASLTYTGNTDVTGTAADTLTVTTDDGGNTGSGAALQDVDNIQIDITAVNDTPVVSGPGSAYSATEQVALTIEGTGFTVSDVDAASGGMTATITVGEGVITVVAGDSGVSISGGNGTGTVTLTGTLSQLDNLLTGAGTGTITYLNSSDTPSASTTITVTVNDGGNTGTDPGLTGDGSSEQDFATQTINITATNDDPTNAGTLPTDISVTEDVSGDVDLSAINLSDVDHGGGNLTVTLSTSTGGNLSASSGGGVTVGGSGTGTLTLTGTLASLNTFLDTASNVQYLHSTAHLNGDNADTINVVVNDLGNTGTGGGTNQNLGTVNVDISAVNDAPVNTVPGTQSVAEETVTAISGISIADVDAGGSNLTTRLQVSNGVLNVTLSGSASISAGSNGSGDLTIQGSVTDINATLASLTYTGDTDVVGTAADTLTVTTNDLGNTGSGGTLQDVDNIQIDITAVNDTPVVSGPGSAYSATEQVALTIEGTGFTVSDVDAASGSMTATIAVGEGAITVAAGDSGVSISGGNGTSSVTLTGTLSQLDNLLTGSGTGTITYLNSSDTPSASTTITVTVNDGGNTGADPGLTGDGTSEQDFAAQTINITAINDDPTNAGSLPSDISVTEDVSSDVDLSSINLSDVDHGGGNLTVTLSTSTGGNLNASSGGGVTVAGSGTSTLTLTGTLASLNTFLDTASNVQYLHSTAISTATTPIPSRSPSTTMATPAPVVAAISLSAWSTWISLPSMTHRS